MGVNGLRQSLKGVGNVHNALHLYKYIQYAMIRDLDQWNLGGVQSIRR